ncbi:hypothetical protein PA25_14480 [Pseudoalteromonas sp. A25]|uniref:hypothetical protein n=1 Tax=Pseudoalteromonas sp. A25 TaxID=116092 RepID=UPI001260FC0F|nr:hypothetical protein [Pseudoalteromonas sp. A25]BBN81463.1 hypothetical protein PA25_14480 [Pseudoalteromonas sp. A25]
MKYIFLILTFLSTAALSIEWADEDCGQWNAYKGKVFSLDIGTSFHGRALFKLCKSETQNFISVLTTQSSRKDEVKEIVETTTRKHINISKEEYEKIFNLYEVALQYNTLDKSSGTDGSNWCIESQRSFTYTKACFWTPSYNSEERGLKGLNDLGSYLWEFANLSKNKEMRLY